MSTTQFKGALGYFKNRDQEKEHTVVRSDLYGVPAASNRHLVLVTVHLSRLDTVIPIVFPLLPYFIPTHPDAYQSIYDFQMRMAREPI
jgi:hypothetical protein